MTTLNITHIVSDPAHRGGRPRIAETGITVQNVVEDLAGGWTVETIADQFDLTLGQIYAALSYYHDHKDEIDRAIEADKAFNAALLVSEEYRASKARDSQLKAALEVKRNRPM